MCWRLGVGQQKLPVEGALGFGEFVDRKTEGKKNYCGGPSFVILSVRSTQGSNV